MYASSRPSNQPRQDTTMYADKKRIKANKLMLRFDDYEFELINAMAAYQGEQPSVFLRELVLREAALLNQNCKQMLSAK